MDNNWNSLLIPFINNVHERYREYKIALNDWIYEAYINNDGDLIYPIALATKLTDTRARYIQADKDLKRIKILIERGEIDRLLQEIENTVLYGIIPEDDMEPFEPLGSILEE